MPQPHDGDDSPRPAKRPKRSYVACSGEKPCRGCVRSGNGSECTFPARERKVTVLESPTVCGGSATNLGTTDDDDENGDEDQGTADVANPLLENRVTIRDDSISSRPVYVGGAACTAFATRLGANIRRSDPSSSPYVVPVLKHETLQRSVNTQFTLPNRAYAQVLVQAVLRFIGHDYHLLRKKSFFERVDRIYEARDQASPLSLCRLFAVFALGELYLKRSGTGHRGERTVPGTQFFLQAVSLFQEQYEEADVDYIETLLLMSFYSHALNRKNTAYTYAGLALRLSVTLGLHRNITYDPNISPAEIENRRRVWWTVYTFDRLCSSKLGHPVMIRDEDIDAPLPSSEGLSKEEQEDFVDARQLTAIIKMSRITGSILSLIYGATSQKTRDFVRNVHTILNNLKQWDTELPVELKLDHSKFPAYSSRSVASLRLSFNQCIILTTRPVLLHVFNHHVKLSRSQDSQQTDKPLSPMTVALSEACIYAARASANLLGQLWADGNIATFGYFDAHYTFSCTAVLMISHALRSNDADKDAIALSCALLESMVEDGNLPAREFFERLAALQKDFDGLEMPPGSGGLLAGGSTRGYVTSSGTFAANVSRGGGRQPRRRRESGNAAANNGISVATPRGSVSSSVGGEGSRGGDHCLANAPLDAPFMQSFLGNCEFDWSPGALDISSEDAGAWSLAWDSSGLV